MELGRPVAGLCSFMHVAYKKRQNIFYFNTLTFMCGLSERFTYVCFEAVLCLKKKKKEKRNEQKPQQTTHTNE